jgi:protein phosphatase
LRQCHARIQVDVVKHPDLEGMGTTLTLAYVVWPKLFVVHAGDSRCYLQRDARLIRLTTDQTIAQQLVDAGFLAAGEAEHHKYSHVLTSAVGGRSNSLEPMARKLYMKSGDALLLCSDGLTRDVPEPQIAEIMAASGSAVAATKELVSAAIKAGGRDNITVVVSRFIVPDDRNEAS